MCPGDRDGARTSTVDHSAVARVVAGSTPTGLSKEGNEMKTIAKRIGLTVVILIVALAACCGIAAIVETEVARVLLGLALGWPAGLGLFVIWTEVR